MSLTLAAIDTAITDVLTYPEKYSKYKMGDKTYDRDGYLRFLGEQRKLILANPDSEIAVVEFADMDVDEFGSIS